MLAEYQWLHDKAHRPKTRSGSSPSRKLEQDPLFWWPAAENLRGRNPRIGVVILGAKETGGIPDEGFEGELRGTNQDGIFP